MEYLAGISFVFGFLVIFGFAFDMFHLPLPNQSKADGFVQALEFARTYKGNKTYYAIIAFDVDGMEYKVKTTYSSSQFKVGQTLRVKYNAMKPEQCRVSPPCGMLALMFTFILVLVAFVLVFIFRGFL